MADPVKYGPLIHVNVENGIPRCPCCHAPMRDRGDNTWDCPLWGPFWDEAIAAMAARFKDSDG